MSYILDALRRADAERQHGHVPGIHAVPAAASATAPTRLPAWQTLRWGLAVLAVLVLVALVLGWQLRGLGSAGPGAAASAPPAAAVAQPVLPPPTAPAGPAPLPIVVSAAATPVPAAVSPAASRPAPPLAGRAVLLSSLTPDERRQLPQLFPGGTVWSEHAPSRFVILDGQVLREGDTVAAGLVLERIERKSVVLRWKDQRLEVPL